MIKDRFKFRAWNKKERIMHYKAEQTYDTFTGSPRIWKQFFSDVLDDENYIVEQCTGLKDKTGNLIFEGDIIKIGSYNAPVVWINGWFLMFGDVLEEVWHFQFFNYAIVGNIHENPELLKGGKE